MESSAAVDGVDPATDDGVAFISATRLFGSKLTVGSLLKRHLRVKEQKKIKGQ